MLTAQSIMELTGHMRWADGENTEGIRERHIAKKCLAEPLIFLCLLHKVST